jgi:Tat protein secretion system quality control protein TatD with DNase activity
MFIDAHTHLNLTDLFEKWKEHIKQFQQAGGKILVNAGAHTDYNRNGILIAQEAKSLFPEVVVKTTIGFHPEDAQNIKESDFPSLIEGLEQQYRQHKEHIIAIGECGIDLHRNQDLEHQQTFFRLQAILARKL